MEDALPALPGAARDSPRRGARWTAVGWRLAIQLVRQRSLRRRLRPLVQPRRGRGRLRMPRLVRGAHPRARTARPPRPDRLQLELLGPDDRLPPPPDGPLPELRPRACGAVRRATPASGAAGRDRRPR